MYISRDALNCNGGAYLLWNDLQIVSSSLTHTLHHLHPDFLLFVVETIMKLGWWGIGKR